MDAVIDGDTLTLPPDFERGVEAAPFPAPHASATSTDEPPLPPPFERGIEAPPFVSGAQSLDLGMCPINALTPITDALARRMEAGERILWDGADPGLRPAAERLTELVRAEPGGSATVTSAFRPQAYQDHLREVWDTARDTRLAQVECAGVRREVEAETGNHGLHVDRPVARVSNHTNGRAFDMSWELPNAADPAARVAELAGMAGLTHPLPLDDRVHFELS